MNNYFSILWQGLPENPPSTKDAWRELIKLLITTSMIIAIGAIGG